MAASSLSRPLVRRQQQSLRASVGVLLDIAERACDHDHPAAAKRLARQSALMAPGRGRAWFVLGRVAATAGDAPTAAEHLVLAASFCPARPGYRLAAGLALADERPGQAITHLRAAVRLCPSWVRARVALACALSAMGCDEDAAYWADALLPEPPVPLATLDATGWKELSSARPEQDPVPAAA